MAQPRVEKENTVYALIYQQNMKKLEILSHDLCRLQHDVNKDESRIEL